MTRRSIDQPSSALYYLVTKNNRRGVNRRASQNKSPKLFNQTQIPTFQSDAVQTLKCRYYVPSSYGSDVLSFTFELPQYPWGISYSTIGMYIPIKSVRIKKVELWCNYRPEQGVEGNTINLSAVERRLVRPIEWSDTATFLTPAHIKKKFMKTEPLGQWYSTTVGESNPELQIQMPKGALLEITFDYILDDSDNVATYGTAGLSATKVYTNSLNANLSVVGKSHATVILI